jgi:hypothetical protein
MEYIWECCPLALLPCLQISGTRHRIEGQMGSGEAVKAELNDEVTVEGYYQFGL